MPEVRLNTKSIEDEYMTAKIDKTTPVLRKLRLRLERAGGKRCVFVARTLLSRGHMPIDISSKGPFRDVIGSGKGMYTVTELRDLLLSTDLMDFNYSTTYEKWIGYPTPALLALVKEYQSVVEPSTIVSIRLDALEDLVRSYIQANDPPVTKEKLEAAKRKLADN